MPTDRDHAFATGGAARINAGLAELVFKPLQLASQPFAFAWKRWRMWVAGQSFRRSAILGKDCRSGPNAWCVNNGPRESIQLGDRVVCRGILRCESWDAAKLKIDADVYIGDDVLISCAQEVSIGSFTLLAHGVQIFDNDSHPLDPRLRELDYRAIMNSRAFSRQPIPAQPVRIGSRAWLGFNVIVMKGVTIGDGSVIGAGSVVIRDIPPYSLAVGNPARVIASVPGAPEQSPSTSQI